MAVRATLERKSLLQPALRVTAFAGDLAMRTGQLEPGATMIERGGVDQTPPGLVMTAAAVRTETALVGVAMAIGAASELDSDEANELAVVRSGF